MAQRPLIEGERTRPVTFRVPESLLAAFDDAAGAEGVDRSTKIRELLEAAVQDFQEAAA